MDRKAELIKLVNNSNSAVLMPLIDKMLYLENQLECLEQLPMIKIHPDRPEIQKATPASKLYKEFLQQYTNLVKVVARITDDENSKETSPLREWVKSRSENLAYQGKKDMDAG